VDHGRHIHFAEVKNMLITFLILKLTLESILNECNKLAAEQQSKAQVRWLKSRLLKLRLEYEKGIINEETYNKMQAEVLKNLRVWS
jgi:hypothetical protein